MLIWCDMLSVWITVRLHYLVKKWDFSLLAFICLKTTWIVQVNYFRLTDDFIRRVTIGGEGGEVFPALFQKLEKKCPNLWGKKCPECGHPRVKFSFKMQFLRVSRRKNQRFFPCGAFLFCFVGECLSKCPNSKKTPLP